MCVCVGGGGGEGGIAFKEMLEVWQTVYTAAPDLGLQGILSVSLHCLLGPVCPNTKG